MSIRCCEYATTLTIRFVREPGTNDVCFIKYAPIHLLYSLINTWYLYPLSLNLYCM